MNKKGKWIADLGNGSFKNPILYADYSDPDVIRVNDDFFMTASSFTYVPGLPILHSKDLINWKIVNYAARKLPERYNKPVHGCGVWAPAIRYNNGRFYIYFGDPDIGIFMTSTDDPFGKWDDLVLVKETVGTIDTCPLWDDDGKAYIVHGYANSRCGIKSKLAVCEMTPDGKRVISDDVIVYDGTVSQPTLEGPKFYKKDGYYYIMAPAGGVPTGWEVILRSKNVYGPYEDRIVLRQGKTDINGPHQGGWIELENGEGWFMHFQDLDAYGRIIHLQPVNWKDGWPTMGENVDSGYCGQPVSECKKPNVGKDYPIEVPQTSDDFDSDNLGLQWQWQANNQDEWFSLSENPGKLRLYAVKTENDNDKLMWNMPNVLTQLWQAPSMTTTVKVEVEEGKIKTKAALAIVGLRYSYISISGSGRLSQVIGTVNGANVKEEIVMDKDLGTSSVYLRSEVCGRVNGKTAKCKFSYSLDGENFIAFGEEFMAKEGKWVGAKHGIFCAGEDGGYADFDDFIVD